MQSDLAGVVEVGGMVLGMVLTLAFVAALVALPIVMLLVRRDVAAIRRLLEQQASRPNPPSA
jgi:hypothetical protein